IDTCRQFDRPASPMTYTLSLHDALPIYFPRPAMANGHIPAHIRAFGRPINTRNQRDTSRCMLNQATCPWATQTKTERLNPSKAQICSILFWAINRGMRVIPNKYPMIVAVNVYEGSAFASTNDNPIESA